MLEKDKEIKMQQIRLREFMQKNLRDLPDFAFQGIEDIISPKAIEETLTARKGSRHMAGAYLNAKKNLLKPRPSNDELLLPEHLMLKKSTIALE